MKLYFIYVSIPRNIYEAKIKYLLSKQYDFRAKHDVMYGMYAISNDKTMVEDFFAVRGYGQYNLIERKCDKELYRELKDAKSDMFLKRVVYEDGEGKPMEIIVTKNEKTIIEYDADQYLAEFGPAARAVIDYYTFNKKFIKALDILGYTTAYDIFHSGDPKRIDVASFQSSYGRSPVGNKLDNDRYTNISKLVYLFDYLFMGEKEDEVI